MEEVDVADDIGLGELCGNRVDLLDLVAPVRVQYRSSLDRSNLDRAGRGRGHLQCTNGPVVVQQGHKRSVSHQVVNTPVANDRSSVGCRLLEAGVLGEVGMKDVDVGAVPQLSGNLFLGRGFIAHQTDHQVLLVFRNLFEEFELCGYIIRWCVRGKCTKHTHPDSLGHSSDHIDRHVE